MALFNLMQKYGFKIYDTETAYNPKYIGEYYKYYC